MIPYFTILPFQNCHFQTSNHSCQNPKISHHKNSSIIQHFKLDNIYKWNITRKNRFEKKSSISNHIKKCCLNCIWYIWNPSVIWENNDINGRRLKIYWSAKSIGKIWEIYRFNFYIIIVVSTQTILYDIWKMDEFFFCLACDILSMGKFSYFPWVFWWFSWIWDERLSLVYVFDAVNKLFLAFCLLNVKRKCWVLVWINSASMIELLE